MIKHVNMPCLVAFFCFVFLTYEGYLFVKLLLQNHSLATITAKGDSLK